MNLLSPEEMELKWPLYTETETSIKSEVRRLAMKPFITLDFLVVQMNNTINQGNGKPLTSFMLLICFYTP